MKYVHAVVRVYGGRPQELVPLLRPVLLASALVAVAFVAGHSVSGDSVIAMQGQALLTGVLLIAFAVATNGWLRGPAQRQAQRQLAQLLAELGRVDVLKTVFPRRELTARERVEEGLPSCVLVLRDALQSSARWPVAQSRMVAAIGIQLLGIYTTALWVIPAYETSTIGNGFFAGAALLACGTAILVAQDLRCRQRRNLRRPWRAVSWPAPDWTPQSNGLMLPSPVGLALFLLPIVLFALFWDTPVVAFAAVSALAALWPLHRRVAEGRLGLTNLGRQWTAPALAATLVGAWWVGRILCWVTGLVALVTIPVLLAVAPTDGFQELIGLIAGTHLLLAVPFGHSRRLVRAEVLVLPTATYLRDGMGAAQRARVTRSVELLHGFTMVAMLVVAAFAAA